MPPVARSQPNMRSVVSVEIEGEISGACQRDYRQPGLRRVAMQGAAESPAGHVVR
jgi:hypothetical protein